MTIGAVQVEHLEVGGEALGLGLQLNTSEVGSTTRAGRSSRPACFSASRWASVSRSCPGPCRRRGCRRGRGVPDAAARPGPRADRAAARRGIPLARRRRPRMPSALRRRVAIAASCCGRGRADRGRPGGWRQLDSRQSWSGRSKRSTSARTSGLMRGADAQAAEGLVLQDHRLVVVDVVQPAGQPARIMREQAGEQRRQRQGLAVDLDAWRQAEPAVLVLVDVEHQVIDVDRVVAEVAREGHFPAFRAQGRHGLSHEAGPGLLAGQPERIAGQAAEARLHRARRDASEAGRGETLRGGALGFLVADQAGAAYRRARDGRRVRRRPRRSTVP